MTTPRKNGRRNPPPLPAKTQPPIKPSCTSPSFLCPDSTCIPPTQICDGVKDCPDGSDEKTCLKRCKNKSDFLCKDRRSCVLKKLVCDGRAHCHDSSDEVDCSPVAPPPPPANRNSVLKCRLGSQLCQDGTQCVPYSHVCDGEKDCQDGSDEEECDTRMTTPPENGRQNQPPLPAKTQPPIKPSCTSPSFLCPDSTCIPPTQICDGVKDCPDGSDEKRCLKRCKNKSDFLCKDRRSCVLKKLVCDGRAHCHDSSDEVDCSPVAPPPPPANRNSPCV
ncbi:LDL receptor repeat-containing protein egg-1-like [Syngnathus acus]|uniref:LDL receptor repeat-containing protein egg-1-like n=1 Tax=Syngnathus acus TaxID=161584 RepID=UPI0018860B40|nr:LDL receptor repeat-containing protein egg-1-like [Syngnathus acus]